MDIDIGTTLLLGLLLIAPAVIVFIVLAVIQSRRGKFHRQRITKKSDKS